MTMLCTLILAVLSLPPQSAADYAERARNLPPWIKSDMAVRFPDWQPAVPDLQQLGYYEGEQSLEIRTQVTLRGDFNGDNRTDVAILFWASNDKRIRRLAVYLARGRSYRYHDLGAIDLKDECWLELAKVGEPLYDYSQDRELRARFQTILIPCLERTGIAFEYRGGRFRRFVWNQWTVQVQPAAAQLAHAPEPAHPTARPLASAVAPAR